MSVESYKNDMIAAKENNDSLSGLTSNSKTSVWGQMFYVMAYCLDILAQLFTTHRKEIDEKIKTQKTHRLEWIRQLYLNFQYGKAIGKDIYLKPETDIYDNTGLTEDEIERSKIIKYCAVTEGLEDREVIIKIATEKDDELAPLSSDEMITIKEYTKQVKGAGIPYRIVNQPPDMLKLGIRIFRDPLVIDGNGIYINAKDGAEKPVEKALKEFMKELPFNGELRIQDLSNKLEQLKGVNIVKIDEVSSSFIDRNRNEEGKNIYGDLYQIDVKKVPESGYFKLILFTQGNENDKFLTSIKYEV